MKLAVISDIHGNLPALQTVTAHLDRWQPDQVIVNGDVVNRGPLSDACWQFVEERRQADGWLVLRGNHEEFVTAWQTRPTPAGDPEPGLYLDSYWVYQQLNGSIPQLTGLPNCHTIPSPDSQELRLTHASMRHNRDGILQQAPAAELRAQIAPAPSVFVTAHTHRPFIRTIDQTQVINVGSVGAPFDGDLRASYAQLTWQPAGGRPTSSASPTTANKPAAISSNPATYTTPAPWSKSSTTNGTPPPPHLALEPTLRRRRPPRRPDPRRIHPTLPRRITPLPSFTATPRPGANREQFLSTLPSNLRQPIPGRVSKL